jgi:hypothetical protein
MLVFSLNFEVGIWLALLTISDLNRALNNVCVCVCARALV